MRWMDGVVTVGLFAGAWLSPQLASACSCTPGVELLWPEDSEEGSVVPEGSFLLLGLFCGVEATLVSDVYVDDESVTLVDGPAYGLKEIVPAPVVGQQVQARVCVDENMDNLQCHEVSFRIEESVPVTLEPPVLTVEYRWQQSVCAWDWEWGVRILIEGPEANAGRPVVYGLDLGDQLDFDNAMAPDGSYAVDREWAGRDLPEAGQEMCVTVRAYDVWGAVAEPTTLCQEAEPAPDVYCADPQEDPNSCPTEPPLPPPQDDDASSSTTGEPPPDEDTGSSTTDESPTSGAEPGATDELSQTGCRAARPSHLWWLLMVAGLWRRRRQQ